MKKLYLFFCLSMYCNFALTQAPSSIWLIPPSTEYKKVEPFSEGCAVVQHANRKETWYAFIDKTGNHLSDAKYELVHPVANGLARVLQPNGTWRFCQSSGECVGDAYEKAFNFFNGFAAVKTKGNWGFINANGEVVVKPQYDWVRYVADNRVSVGKGDKQWLIHPANPHFEPILIEKPYKMIGVFSEGLAMVKDALGDVGYIDTTGAEVISVKKGRKYASAFFNGLAAVSDAPPKLTFLNKQKKIEFEVAQGTFRGTSTEIDISIDSCMHNIHRFSEGFAAVRKGGKWGYVDLAGKDTIPFIYDGATRFSEGFAAVKKDGKWLYINKFNEEVTPNNFLDAKPCTEGTAWVKTEIGWGLLDLRQQLEIVWESPFKAGNSNAQVTLRAKLSSSQVLTTIQLEYNGKIVKELDTRSKHLFEMTFETPFVLNTGKNVFKLIAKNKIGTQVANQCVLHYQPQPSKYYAVMIANNEYEFADPLKNRPIEDAERFAQILQENYQFSRVLTLHDATHAQMKAVFEDLTKHKDPTERLLIFYAGHGDMDSVHQMAYLVPVDARGGDFKNQLSAFTFAQYVKSMPSNRILSVLDACFAGSFVLDAHSEHRESRTATANVRPKKSRIQPDFEDFDELETEKCRSVISSGQRKVVPNESGFIKFLFKVLVENKALKIDDKTLFLNLKATIDNGEAVIPQHGVLQNGGSDGGGFLFRRKKI